MTVKLSDAARAALMNAPCSRQGATIPASTHGPVVAELRNAGLVGAYGGLTRAGTVERDRAVTALMDQLL